MEESPLYSPESMDSVLELSDFQGVYDYNEHPGILNDFDIGIDADSVYPSTSSQYHSFNQFEFDSNQDVIVCKDNGITTPGISASDLHTTPTIARDSLNHFDCFNSNKRFKAVGQVFGVDKKNPVGDSNSKNAIAARDNRQKKKKYVAELEKTVKILRIDNESLSKEVIVNKNRLNTLENEVKYLRSVIANQSTLSSILDSVAKTPGISLFTSIGDNMNQVDKSNRNSKEKSINSAEVKNFSNSRSCPRNLRSHAKHRTKRWVDKGVTNMTAKEIVLCCKDKKIKKLNNPDPEDSETDSEMEEIDVVEDYSSKAVASLPPEEDYGGVCLHVTGKKVSLEFCASCNMKSNTNVSLDHSYSHIVT